MKEDLEKLPKLKKKFRAGPKSKGPRKTITDSVMLEVLLDQGTIYCPCGCKTRIVTMAGTVREHTWALENRPTNPDGTVTPDANDPSHIRLWLAGHDKQKTFGPGGEQRITTKGSDNHKRIHTEKNSKSHAEHMARMHRKTFGEDF